MITIEKKAYSVAEINFDGKVLKFDKITMHDSTEFDKLLRWIATVDWLNDIRAYLETKCIEWDSEWLFEYIFNAPINEMTSLLMDFLAELGIQRQDQSKK